MFLVLAALPHILHINHETISKSVLVITELFLEESHKDSN